MTIEYIKNEEGKVEVRETKVEAVVKDLHELKVRKAEIENKLTGWHERFVEQKWVELEREGLRMNGEMTVLQAELDVVNAQIIGAETAGVIEVIPPPEPEPPVEKPIV